MSSFRSTYIYDGCVLCVHGMFPDERVRAMRGRREKKKKQTREFHQEFS